MKVAVVVFQEVITMNEIRVEILGINVLPLGIFKRFILEYQRLHKIWLSFSETFANNILTPFECM